MYDKLVKRLRRCEQFRCREFEYEQVIRCRAKLNEEAADAIEKMQRCIDDIEADNESHCERIAKMEKATQEHPSHSPSLGYYYAFLFDETTGKTYMPKEE